MGLWSAQKAVAFSIGGVAFVTTIGFGNKLNMQDDALQLHAFGTSAVCLCG
jgi:hypothetical protein